VTVTDDQQAARAADVQQAAHFRDALAAERELLIGDINKRRPLIDRPSDAGRVRRGVQSAEAQLRYVDRLIARLDGRFPPDVGTFYRT
jgi:hypothetical protein